MENKIITVTNAGRVQYNDLRDSSINQAFAELFKVCFAGVIDDFETRVDAFLPGFFVSATQFLRGRNNEIEVHDHFFENFTPISEKFLWQRGFSEQASWLWAKVAEFIKGFEEKNFQLHKGSLYYFWSIPLMLLERIDASILALHRAVLEDKRNKPKGWQNNPANLVLTLSASPIPYRKEFIIDPLARFINARITSYNTNYSRNFSLSKLRTSFLSESATESEMKYYFTLSVYKLVHIRRLSKLGLGQSTIGPLIFNSAIGSMLLLWENLLKQKYKNHHPDAQRASLNQLVAWVLEDSGLAWGNSAMSNTQRASNQAKRSFISCIKSRKDRNLRQDLLIGYVLRNNSFHSLKSDNYLWDIHSDLMQIVMNCLFITLET